MIGARTQSAALDPAGLDRLVELVRRFSGLEFPDNRRQGLERSVTRALALHDLTDVDGLVRLLSQPARHLDLEAFTASLTIGETHFFRNAPQLDALRTHVLPELIVRRGGERRLRLWSAGCSTGEEAYSLAMLVDTLLPRRDGWNVLILATDINKAALERARRGVYGQWSFRQVPEEIQRRYFTRRDGAFHLAPEIREMVSFGYLNLVDDTYPSMMSNTQGMDLILCRNVLIYFRQETINAVVGRLDDALVPGGWLVAGHAESPMPVFRERFAARDFPMAVLYQKPAAAPMHGTDPPPAVVAGPIREPARRPRHAPAPPQADPAPVVDALAPVLERWRAGATDEALGQLQDLADADPSDPRPLHWAAKILASQLRLDAAEHIARLALARAPLSAPIHYLHGLVLQELGRHAEALGALRRCVYLDPTCALGHYALASLLVATGQQARADRALAATIELVRDKPRDGLIGEGDGVTFGRLLDLAEVQRHLIAPEVT